MKSIFVYNPESGKSSVVKLKDYILNKLSKKFGEIDCVATTHAGHAKELAKESIGKYDYFFIAGGDGTLHEVVNGFGSSETKPIIGYIPCGTVNDIARSIGISRNIKKSVKTIMKGKPFEHDIFRLNRRYGIYVCCTGLFTKSSYDTDRYNKKKYGKIAYFNRGVNEIKDCKPVAVTLEINGETIQKNCGLVLILNSRSVAGFPINKKAKLDDGEVEIVLFHSNKKNIPFDEISIIFKAFTLGIDSVKNHPSVIYRKASNFKITTNDGTIINLDGEKSDEGSFNFTVLPKAIKIIAPVKHKKLFFKIK